MTPSGRVIFSIFTTGIVLSILVMGAVPPVSRDALTHHLAVPKLYVQAGRILELPDISFSYYPQLLELLYLVPLSAGNDILPKILHFGFALLTGLILFFHLKKRINTGYGLMGSLFFLSLPIIVKLSVTVYVDLGLIFFSTLALTALLKWRDSGYRFRYLGLSGLWCGFAMGTKYNGLVCWLIFSFLVPMIFIHGRRNHGRPKSRAAKAALWSICFFLIAGAVFSPWAVKNTIWTGNPVYPLFERQLQTNKTGDHVETATSHPMNHFLIRKFVFHEKWWETLLIPLRIFFQGNDDDPRLFDGRLNPLLLFLPLVALFMGHNSAYGFEIKLLGLFACLNIIFVFLLHDMRIRYLGPALPPLVILSAYGLKLGAQKINRQFIRGVFIPIVLCLFSLNLFYMADLFKKIDPLPYLLGQVSRSAYILKHRPEFGVLDYANTHLGGDTKIWAFFLGQRRYYSDHDIYFDMDQFHETVKVSASARQIYQFLVGQGFTHLAINYPKFNIWLASEWDTREKTLLALFLKDHVQALYSQHQHGLYRLKKAG